MQFALNRREKDGATLREHLEMAYKATGIRHKYLKDEKPLPWATAHIWQYFLELHAERPSNGMTPGRITSTAIKDWRELTATRLDLWEIRAIRILDNLWIESVNDN